MKTPLRLAREKRNLTLGAIASAVGSDVGNLSRIERGVQIPNSDLAAKIVSLFDGEINELHLIYPERYTSAEAPAPAVDQRTADRREADRRESDRRKPDASTPQTERGERS